MCRDTMRDTLTETRVENFDLGGRDLIFRSVAVAAIGYSEFAAARSDADGRGLILIVKIPYTGVHAIRVEKKRDLRASTYDARVYALRFTAALPRFGAMRCGPVRAGPASR